eukprot:PITA_02045
MLQGTPTIKEAKAFKQILSEFARAAGTEVSLTKSKIFFFNTDILIQRSLSRILGFQRETLPVKYLGVPLTDKSFHKDIWEPVLNKLKHKINKWTNRALNLAGRLVLTNVFLQSIPIYMLSTIPAPTGVMTNIRNIQRDFLWGKGILNRVLGAKIWWRWLKDIQAPWEKLWKHKYASKWKEENLIRMTGQVKGSTIWNRAWENRALVQNHSFWEIKNGNLAWFWEDNWQQEDKLRSEDLAYIHTDTISKGLNWVSDYWDQARNDKKWRTWKLPNYSGMGMLHTQATALQGILDKRKILNSKLNDQLRWGKNKTGLFNLKEAKRIDAGLNHPNTDKTWKEIWENPHWMKVKLFKWLVQQGKILTWDNLRKRGFVGPSRCHLCRQ